MSEPDIILAPAVETELWAICEFIAEDSADAAGRFIEAVYETFKFLAENAKVGEPRRFHARKLKGIRSWPVSQFRNFLIFYRPVRTGIHILHGYHGARDIERLFER